MEIIAFEKNVSRQEARRIAEEKGTILWKAVFANKPLTELRLRYIEYKIIEVSMHFKVTPFLRMRNNAKHSIRSLLSFKGDGTQEKSQPPILIDKDASSGLHKILIISNGTSGAPALVDTIPEIEQIEIDEEEYEDIVQEADFTEDEMITNAKKLAVRVMHRMVGGIPEVGNIRTKTIYRPFYVAFYGDVVEGNKVRYITIPADSGYTTKRGEMS